MNRGSNGMNQGSTGDDQDEQWTTGAPPRRTGNDRHGTGNNQNGTWNNRDSTSYGNAPMEPLYISKPALCWDATSIHQGYAWALPGTTGVCQYTGRFLLSPGLHLGITGDDRGSSGVVDRLQLGQCQEIVFAGRPTEALPAILTVVLRYHEYPG
ncbi:hypothetical protein DPMN_004570 [Dreissena polymorpha]|uniref:Uncharacterized protein n=1 Tax=Dreissena polymorpha TaxID=45954 RepID=A0A9D4RTN6_DREPO|nr:hypothetical protein DPMN_004570 [Dreissena polymorpha]